MPIMPILTLDKNIFKDSRISDSVHLIFIKLVSLYLKLNE